MIIKQITPTSWILTSNITGKRIGIAIKKDDIISLVQEPGKQFESLEQIAEHFGEKVSEQVENKDAEQIVSDVEGYPIKHEKAFEISSDAENNLYTYKTKEGGKLTFVAGYFGVKFKSGYVASFCPKIETLLENDYIGPYKDKFDMQFNLLKHNREK